MDFYDHGGIRTRDPSKQTHVLYGAATLIGLCDLSSRLHRATNSNKMHVNNDGNQKWKGGNNG